MKLLRFILLCLIFSSPLSALSIQNKIEQGAIGDYILYRQSQLVTLLRINQLNDESIIFEEISLPFSEWKKYRNIPLEKWVSNGATGHSSWTLFELEKESGEILECFSFVRQAWLKLEKDNLLLSNLFTKPLYKLKNEDRRKVGPRRPGATDTRKVWNPPITLNGKELTSPLEVYKIHWPKDDSPLSKKDIEMYFSKEMGTFPAWILISDTSSDALRIQTLDMGSSLVASLKKLPRRHPSIHKHICNQNDSFSVQLSSPPYYKFFTLRLINTNPEKASFAPKFTTNDLKGEIREISISKEELKDLELGEYILEFSFTSPEQVTLSPQEHIYWY